SPYTTLFRFSVYGSRWRVPRCPYGSGSTSQTILVVTALGTPIVPQCAAATSGHSPHTALEGGLRRTDRQCPSRLLSHHHSESCTAALLCVCLQASAV